jgi:hypothetical protein
MSFSTPIKMEEEIKKEVGSQSDVDLEKASATSELGAEVAAITSFAQFPWMSDMAPTSNMQDSSTLAEAEAEAADSVEAVTNLCSEVSPPATPVLQSSLLPPPPPLQRCGGPPALKASPAAAAAALAGRKLHTSSPPSLTVSPSLQPSQAKGTIAEDRVGLVETPALHPDSKSAFHSLPPLQNSLRPSRAEDPNREELIIELIQKNLSLQEQVKIWRKKFEIKEVELKKSNLTSVQLWKLLMQEHKKQAVQEREMKVATISKKKKSKNSNKEVEVEQNSETLDAIQESNLENGKTKKKKKDKKQNRGMETPGDWREYRRWCKEVDQKMNADWAEYVTEYERRIAEEEDERRIAEQAAEDERVARQATEYESSEQYEDDEDRESQDEDTQTPEGDWDDYQDNEDQEYVDEGNEDRESQDEDTQTPEGDWDDYQDNEDQECVDEEDEDQDQDQDQDREYREDEECGDEDVGGDEGKKYDGKYFNDEEFPAEVTQS